MRCPATRSHTILYNELILLTDSVCIVYNEAAISKHVKFTCLLVAASIPFALIDMSNELMTFQSIRMLRCTVLVYWLQTGHLFFNIKF